MKLFSTLIGLLIVLAALCFALSNREAVSVSLWPFNGSLVLPLYLLSLGALLAGAIVAWLAMIPHSIETSLQTCRLRREIKDLNQRIVDLQQTVLAPRSPSNRAVNDAEPARSKFRFWDSWSRKA